MASLPFLLSALLLLAGSLALDGRDLPRCESERTHPSEDPDEWCQGSPPATTPGPPAPTWDGDDVVVVD